MPKVGFVDSSGRDVAEKYVTKDYVMSAYPDLIDTSRDPTLWTWGYSNTNALGGARATTASSPETTYGGGANWQQIATGPIDSSQTQSHCIAIKTDGTLWTWGYNGNGVGVLGDSSTVANRSSPVTTAGGGTNWKFASTGGYFCAGIKTDGTMWTWGYNIYGELGDGSTKAKSSPAQTTGTNTNWEQVSCGPAFTAAVKTDGTLWTWGANNFGQLGTGTTTNRSSPGTPAGGGTNWKQSSCDPDVDSALTIATGYMAAVKTDGTLWTWGRNNRGQLGDGTTTNRSSPGTTAGGGTDWKQISCKNSMAAAIKNDGTLWTWGENSSGQLGDGTITARSSPGTTASGGTNWRSIGAGLACAGIKTDGTLWTWGGGSTGNGTTSNRSSPGTTVYPGYLGGVSWKSVSGGQVMGAIIEPGGW